MTVGALTVCAAGCGGADVNRTYLVTNLTNEVVTMCAVDDGEVVTRPLSLFLTAEFDAAHLLEHMIGRIPVVIDSENGIADGSLESALEELCY